MHTLNEWIVWYVNYISIKLLGKLCRWSSSQPLSKATPMNYSVAVAANTLSSPHFPTFDKIAIFLHTGVKPFQNGYWGECVLIHEKRKRKMPELLVCLMRLPCLRTPFQAGVQLHYSTVTTHHCWQWWWCQLVTGLKNLAASDTTDDFFLYDSFSCLAPSVIVVSLPISIVPPFGLFV